MKLQAVETKGAERKLLRLFDGPYEVVGKESPTEYTVQKVGEEKRVKVRVHVDRLHYKPSCTASCILSRLSNLRLSCRFAQFA